MQLGCVALALLVLPQTDELAREIDRLAPFEGDVAQPVQADYLVDDVARSAGVYRSADGREIVLDNGLVRRVWRLAPFRQVEGSSGGESEGMTAACVALDDLVVNRSLLRAVQPEARLVLDGASYDVGGLLGQPDQAYLSEDWIEALEPAPGALRLVAVDVSEPSERVSWKRVRHHAPDASWPPAGVVLRMDYALPDHPSSLVSIHYELYDGLPALSKWITVKNGTSEPILLERFTSELLALVEHSNWVETRPGATQPRPSGLHVETDFAFGGFQPENANRHAVHWRTDAEYTTQVNYLLQTPCLLVVEPTYGPAQSIAPGTSFESFRTFELIQDGDRERRGLALRRLYRTLAPWVTENPLMHHMRTADPEAVRGAIDQAAEVGFEMIILSFGSGFDIENEDPAYLAQWKEIADYAREKGIEIGGYSLLSSRRIGDGNDIVSPTGSQPTHGSCPALTSPWGQEYYRKLYAFFEATGFTLLEHDGPYPGDVDVTPRPPLQSGEADSRWVQWTIAADFYRWCRARGIYLNAPDYYYLVGSSKCGMGYRETNWSLPRAQQVIHTRQNIFDGTWRKTPSMGWMFVPLSEYHGGGEAATIEPLHEHLEHYRAMLRSNLAFGVQACYRGPRLYDTAETRDVLRAEVEWFKRYRDILESDVIHGRRADGRDLDWMLHVNPRLEEKGLLVVFNPLERPVERTLRPNLYYTGLDEYARVAHEDGVQVLMELDRQYQIELEVQVPAEGMTWYVFR